MAEREYSFEEIDRQIKGLDLAGMNERAAGMATETWKQAIRTFIRLMDLVCPQ